MYKKFLLFLFFVGFVLSVNAGFQDFKFKYLTVDDGLSNNRIRCVFRDSKDFVWIGTNSGLNRWDGTNINVFTRDLSDTTTLSNNGIVCISEDQNGLIWVGTNFGLNQFNPKTEKFIHYIPNKANPKSISGENITDIVHDRFGALWISTRNGFSRYNSATNDFTRFRIPATENNQLNNFIYSIDYDDHNTLWFCSKSDVIWSFDILTEKFTQYEHPALKLTLNTRKRIAIDGTRVWIGSYGLGLFMLDYSTKKCVSYPGTEGDKGTMGYNVENVEVASDNYLYVSLDHGGISRLNLKDLTFEHCVHDESYYRGLNNNGIWTVSIDSEGIMYVGTSSNGLNIHNPKENQFSKFEHIAYNENSLSYNIIVKFFEDSKGKIWIGTDGGGLSSFDPKNQTFKNYLHNAADRTSISGNAVLCIGEDSKHNIWAGTWGEGLNKLDPKTGKFTRFYHAANDSSTLSSNNIFDLMIDKKDQIWLAYVLDHGIDVFDSSKGIVKRFREIAGDSTSLIGNRVIGIRPFGSKYGLLTNVGFFMLDPETYKLDRWSSLFKVYLNDAFLDSKGNYWFSSTEKGLIKLSPNGNIEHLDKKDGFLSNWIGSVSEDKNGIIWISSNGGLSKYDPEKKLLTHNFLSEESSNKKFAIISSFRSSDGTFYLGGYNGFYCFKPEELVENNYLPKVIINEFQIFNKTVTPNEPGSFLTNSILETKEIKLSYKESVISFGFNAKNYTYPKKGKFKYILDGYDKDWTETGFDRRFVTYTNLNPGTYTFKVKASNNDNIWNETPTTITLIITPPFWEQWWFRFLVVFIIVGSSITFYFWRIRELKRQHRILEETVLERTTQLREVNSELEQSKEEILSQNEAIQTQNRELESAIQTKNKLFSIIAHDLKNPFNTIMGFVNVLIDDYDKISVEEKKNFLEIIKDSSESAYNLIGNLLDWARTQTNRISIKPLSVQVLELVYRNVQLIKCTADNKNLTIIYDGIKPTLKIFADINMVDTVMRNLLTNAIKFSPEGAVIQIKAIQENDQVLISVIDQGVGMSPEKIERLFEVQYNQTTQGTSGEQGTGLGLIICKEFIEKNGGEIKVKSIQNVGTEFIISIPKST